MLCKKQKTYKQGSTSAKFVMVYDFYFGNSCKNWASFRKLALHFSTENLAKILICLAINFLSKQET